VRPTVEALAIVDEVLDDGGQSGNPWFDAYS
jgi:hypothetical protein